MDRNDAAADTHDADGGPAPGVVLVALSTLGGLVVTAVGLFVLPRFAVIMSDFDAKLPIPTIAAINVPRAAWPAIGLGPLVVHLIGRWLIADRRTRIAVDLAMIGVEAVVVIWLIIAMAAPYPALLNAVSGP